jgi:hypothetical protein
MYVLRGAQHPNCTRERQQHIQLGNSNIAAHGSNSTLEYCWK